MVKYEYNIFPSAVEELPHFRFEVDNKPIKSCHATGVAFFGEGWGGLLPVSSAEAEQQTSEHSAAPPGGVTLQGR